MKRLLLALFILLSGSLSASVLDSITVYTSEDLEIFNDYVSKFSERKDLPMNELLLETGFYFLDTPYVSYTLEAAAPQEKLIINLRELDCTTFTETCLALSRTIKSDTISFENYAHELMKIRYRNGVLEDYASRLHYFFDWICDNDKLDIVRDVTLENGGSPFLIRFDIMSRLGAKNYPQLADTTLLTKIAKIENELTQQSYHYVPKTMVDSVDIQNGDILAMTLVGKGLDIMHMGIAVRNQYGLYFMHASSTGKKVMITPVTFNEYLMDIKAATGVAIVRPLELLCR